MTEPKKAAPIRWILGVCVAAFAVILYIWPDALPSLWTNLTHPSDFQKGAIFAVAAGFFTSLIVAYIVDIRRKAVWDNDVQLLKDVLGGLRSDYDRHLTRLIPAIGGDFTKSLFAYPPMVSKGIAGILSSIVGRLYERHHSRMLVEAAEDTYQIQRLAEIVLDKTPVLVWELGFHISWTWKNDSEDDKRPLDDFLLLAVANFEALANFGGTANENEDLAKERFAKYSESDKVVRLIIPNPEDLKTRIPVGQISKVLTIKKVVVESADPSGRKESETILGPDLPKVESGLPTLGVYSAYSLPKKERGPLVSGGTLRIDYFGTICFAAARFGEELRGYIGFPPADNIHGEYKFKLLGPKALVNNGKTYAIDVDETQSGCQYIHGPLEKTPREVDQTVMDAWGFEHQNPGFKATIELEELTVLHRVAVTWKGTPLVTETATAKSAVAATAQPPGAATGAVTASAG